MNYLSLFARRSLTEFVTELPMARANNSCQFVSPDYSIALGGSVVPKLKIKPAASISKLFLLAFQNPLTRSPRKGNNYD